MAPRWPGEAVSCELLQGIMLCVHDLARPFERMQAMSRQLQWAGATAGHCHLMPFETC